MQNNLYAKSNFTFDFVAVLKIRLNHILII